MSRGRGALTPNLSDCTSGLCPCAVLRRCPGRPAAPAPRHILPPLPHQPPQASFGPRCAYYLPREVSPTPLTSAPHGTCHVLQHSCRLIYSEGALRTMTEMYYARPHGSPPQPTRPGTPPRLLTCHPCPPGVIPVWG